MNEIILGDCLEVMGRMPSCSVDMVLTSPPYNFGGFDRNGRKSSYDNYSDALPEEEYKSWIGRVLSECSRILKEGGVMYWNHKGKFENHVYKHPFGVIDLCPIPLYQHIVWKYPSSPDVAKVKFYPRHEEIFMFSKGVPSYFDEEMAQIGDVWEISHMQKVEHPAPFPFNLARRCIRASCDRGGSSMTHLWGVVRLRWRRLIWGGISWGVR